MREYKFRAWDSWWDKMHYFDFTKNIEATPDDELVEVKDPLKQGLKLNHPSSTSLSLCFVEVKDPLKQGLKLANYN